MNKYGCRTVTIIGAIIAAGGLALSMFATSITYLFFSVGVCAGKDEHGEQGEHGELGEHGEHDERVCHLNHLTVLLRWDFHRENSENTLFL